MCMHACMQECTDARVQAQGDREIRGYREVQEYTRVEGRAGVQGGAGATRYKGMRGYSEGNGDRGNPGSTRVQRGAEIQGYSKV